MYKTGKTERKHENNTNKYFLQFSVFGAKGSQKSGWVSVLRKCNLVLRKAK